MICLISLAALVLFFMLGMFPRLNTAIVFAPLAVAVAGFIAAGIAFAVTPVTTDTSTYALRPLTPAAAASPAYLSTASGSTSYAYDDKGAIRTASTDDGQSVEIRQDGGSTPHVEIVHRERRNELFYLADDGNSHDPVVFHIPAGSPLTR